MPVAPVASTGPGLPVEEPNRLAEEVRRRVDEGADTGIASSRVDAAKQALLKEATDSGRLLVTAFLMLEPRSRWPILPAHTNGGNGAGQSGQCTGPQEDRPASCQSQGGPEDKP